MQLDYSKIEWLVDGDDSDGPFDITVLERDVESLITNRSSNMRNIFLIRTCEYDIKIGDITTCDVTDKTNDIRKVISPDEIIAFYLNLHKIKFFAENKAHLFKINDIDKPLELINIWDFGESVLMIESYSDYDFLRTASGRIMRNNGSMIPHLM